MIVLAWASPRNTLYEIWCSSSITILKMIFINITLYGRNLVCDKRGCDHPPSILLLEDEIWVRTGKYFVHIWKNALLWITICLFCLFVSLLSHLWLIHLFYIHILYQPYVGLCQATCIQSHQRQPTSAGVGCWFSYRSNCSHWSFKATVLPISPNIYTDQREPIITYHSITFTGRYTTMQPTLLTSWLQLLSYKV